jgi:hypothetical protein
MGRKDEPDVEIHKANADLLPHKGQRMPEEGAVDAGAD